MHKFVQTFSHYNIYLALRTLHTVAYTYQCAPKCKSRMTEQFINRAKKSLRQIMASPDVLSADEPLKAFSDALLNFHNHYCLDIHSSEWCKYHSKVISYHHACYLVFVH